MSAWICICPSLREYVRGATVGGSNKMVEILSNSGDVADMVAMLVTDAGSAVGKGDLADRPMAGRWAGRRICWVTTWHDEDPEGRWDEDFKLSNASEEAMDNWTDIGPEMVDGMLGVHGRALLMQSFRTTHLDGEVSVHVHRLPMPVLRRDDAVVPDLSWIGEHHNYLRIYEESAEHMAGIDPDVLIAAIDIAAGRRRLIVNLDRREYIDPVALGETPTLAGIVLASAKNCGGQLEDHAEHRLLPISLRMMTELMMDGREWWNDRVVLTGAGQEYIPSTDAVLGDRTYRDRTHAILARGTVPDMTVIAKRLAEAKMRR